MVENEKQTNKEKLKDITNSIVLFVPVPHSSTGKNNSSSVIAEMQNHEGYSKVEVLSGNNAVKITKLNFRKTLSQLVTEQYI